MAEPQKLILMVQPLRLQGLIWQTVLKSQQLSVVWESPEANLAENLDQLKAAGLILPDLLLIDMQVPKLNPYAFCRWCREQYPGLKVVLTNSGQTEISLAERQWAVNQGASDLLPGFQKDNLVSGVAASVKRVLEILGGHPLNNGALISVLLSMKRELEARAAKEKTHPLERKNGTNGAASKALTSLEQLSAKPTAVYPNGNGKELIAKPSNGNGKVLGHEQPDLNRNGHALNEASGDRPDPPPPTEESEDSATNRRKRRYRGLYY